MDLYIMNSYTHTHTHTHTLYAGREYIFAMRGSSVLHVCKINIVNFVNHVNRVNLHSH